MENGGAVVKKTGNDTSRLSNSEVDLLLQSLVKDDEYNSFRSYLLNSSNSNGPLRTNESMSSTFPIDDKMLFKQKCHASDSDVDLPHKQSSQHQLLRKMMTIIDDSASNVKISETEHMHTSKTTSQRNLIPYYAIAFLIIANVYGYLLINVLDGIIHLNGRVANFLQNFWLKLKHFSIVQKENVLVLQLCVLPIFILMALLYATLWLLAKVLGLFVRPVPRCIAKFVDIKYYSFDA